MSSREKKSSPWSEFEGLIDNANRLAGLAAAVIAAITFANGPHYVSYAFIVIACVSLDWFLWRLTHPRGVQPPAVRVDGEPERAVLPPPRPTLPRAVGFGAIAVVTLAAVSWTGVNVAADFRKAQGILFEPAQPGEVLIIVAQFDNRAGADKGVDMPGRIVPVLKAEVEKAKIQNVRIESQKWNDASVIGDEKTARQIGAVHSALLIIWGWYDARGFRPYFTITSEKKSRLSDPPLNLVPIQPQPNDDYINFTVPAQMSYFAVFTLGQVYYWEYKDDEALTALNSAADDLERTPVTPGVNVPSGAEYLYYERAYILSDVKGSYAQALQDLDRAIVLKPDFAKAYARKGWVYFEQGKSDQAIPAFTQALRLDSKLAPALIGRGRAYFAQGDNDKARADYDQVIQVEPQDAESYQARGDAYLYRGLITADPGDFAHAVASYDTSIRLDTTNAVAVNNRGSAYANEHNLDAAIADYTQAIRIDPTYPLPYRNRGDTYRDRKRGQGDLRQAIADLTQANLSEALRDWAQSDLDRAISDYTKGIDLNPKDTDAYNGRANVYYDQKQYDLALADYNKAIELRPNYELAYYNRGLVYKDKGDYDAAIADNTKALELDPQDAYAYNNRGWAQYLKKNFDLAIPDFTKSIELDPKNENAYYNRGLAYAAKSDDERAIADYNKTLELTPQDASLYYNRGIAYRQEGLKTQAIADFETYLRLVPNSSKRAQVEQWIRELQGQ